MNQTPNVNDIINELSKFFTEGNSIKLHETKDDENIRLRITIYVGVSFDIFSEKGLYRFRTLDIYYDKPTFIEFNAKQYEYPNDFAKLAEAILQSCRKHG